MLYNILVKPKIEYFITISSLRPIDPNIIKI